MINFFKKIKNSGFALLFTVVLVSIILMVVMGISNVALKEVLLSTSGKDANDAFFAADAGVECALFMESQSAFGGPPTLDLCANATGGQIILDNLNWIQDTETFSFTLLNLGPDARSCANVVADKDSLAGTTEITSKGYNTFDNNTCSSGNRRVERELFVTY